jgi:hypothetical protein
MSRETMTRYKDGLLLYRAVPSSLRPCFSSFNFPCNFVIFVVFVVRWIGNNRATP